MNPSATSFRRPRGSVMILVVAVLALLAILGTVFIVSSRSQRASSAAMSADLNLTYARQGALSAVQQAIGDSMLDAGAQIGGIQSVPPHLAARSYDYPEVGSTYGQTNINAAMRDEPWLVQHTHRQAAPTTNDLSILMPAPFNPATGAFSGIPYTLFPYDATIGALSTVVGDQTKPTRDSTLDDPPTALPDAYINLLPFSDQTGVRYRYGVRIIDTSRMANVNTGSNDDTAALSDTTGTYIDSLRLAPAVADMDYTTNAYFNYGTGTAGDGVAVSGIDMKTAIQQSQPISSPNSGLGRAGTSVANATFNLANWEAQILRFENPSDGAIALFGLDDELELRSYGEYGTNYRPRLANPPSTGSSTGNAYRVWPYTFGVSASAGAFSLTGGSVIGNPRRRNYTAYNFDRRYRPYVDPKSLATPIPDYTLVPIAGASNPNPTVVPAGYAIDANGICQVFPSSRLQQIYVNVPMSIGSAVAANDAMFYMASTATNLATLMESACSPPPVAIVATVDGNPNHPNVFTHAESLAFAVNYMMARSDGMVPDTTLASPPAGGAYYLPLGPSFVDDQGICVRTAAAVGTTYGRDFGKSVDPTNPSLTTAGLDSDPSKNIICLGYAAQPFINEIAVQEGADKSGASPVTVVSDSAIELHNPYNVNLSLNGFHLKVFVGAGTVPTSDIDLTGQYIPAKGYLVVVATGSPELAGKVTVGASVILFTAPVAASFTPTSLNAAGGTVVLYRPYFSRNTLTQRLAPVDQMDYTTLMDPTGLPDLATPGAAVDNSVARTNSAVATDAQWNAAINTANPRATATLGLPNNNGAAGGIVLYDRYAFTPALPQGSQFSNINDFNTTMRLATFFDATDDANPVIPTTLNPNVPPALIPDKIPALATTASAVPYATMDFPIDAQMHFDFLAPPYIFNTTPTAYPNPIPGAAPMKSGDIRAVHLLDQISFIDRVADTSISAASLGLASTIDKLRIPGRININTASGDVLRAIPAVQFTANPNQTVANILAYRDRLAANTVRYPPNTGTPNSVDYSDHASPTSKYPGLGFRSMAELLNVMAVTGAANLQSRDAQWAAAYNLCTVRSDTFVVYGYMEAVRQNPAYTGLFNNAQDWYGAVTDDPHDTNIANIPLLRVATRRWVAIIDRSFCNYDRGSAGFTLPKVVAIKDLPQ